ncbi:MAG: TonB-dependent receptor family protein [Gammaproteobacteria bacterium]
MTTATSALAEHDARSPAAGLETLYVSGQATALATLTVEQTLTPGGATIVDIDRERSRQIGSLADMLRFVPGVLAASNSGTDSMFFSSRGSNLDATNFDMNGIKLLQDGLPVTTADGNNHNRIIDPLTAAFATVARGANGMKYGASTLGGAIDFVSATARNSPALRMFVNGGSFGQLQGQLTASRVFDHGFDGLITVEGKQWDGYRQHNEQDRAGLYANLGWRVNDALETRLFLTYVDNEQALPGALTRARFKDDPDQANPKAVRGDYRLEVETVRVASKTTWTIDAARWLEFGMSYEHQALFHPIVDRVLVDFDGPGPAPLVEVFSLLVDTDHEDIGTMARYHHRLGDHDLLLGVNYGENAVRGGNFRNLGGQRNGLRTRVDNDASTLELYTADRWRFLPRWTAVLAAQGVRAEREVRNFNVATNVLLNPRATYHGINPSLGLVFAARPTIDLYANVSRLYEPPTNFELEDNTVGNDTPLNAMHGEVVEAGSRGRDAIGHASEVFWDVSLYHAWIQDEILSVDDPAAPGNSLSTNVDSTVHAGVEMLLGARFALDAAATHVIAPLVNITFNAFSFDDDTAFGNNELPAAPDVFLRGEILYRHSAGWYIGPTIDAMTSRWVDFQNTYRIGGHVLLGLRAGRDTKHYRLYIDARNLLGKDFVATHSVFNFAAANAEALNPGEPRAIYAGLEVRF